MAVLVRVALHVRLPNSDDWLGSYRVSRGCLEASQLTNLRAIAITRCASLHRS
jgi:hypothetical protein